MTSREVLEELKEMTKDDKNPRVDLLLDLIHHELTDAATATPTADPVSTKGEEPDFFVMDINPADEITESPETSVESATPCPGHQKAKKASRDEQFFIDQMQGHCAELKMFSMTCRQLYHELNNNSSTDYWSGPGDEKWLAQRLGPAIDAMAFRLDELSRTFERFVSYSFDHM